MRDRRGHFEDIENHDRWLVSYADFITLLFAFFVVMYAVSSVNEGKYRVFADVMQNIFSPQDSQLASLRSGQFRQLPQVIEDSALQRVNIVPDLRPLPVVPIEPPPEVQQEPEADEPSPEPTAAAPSLAAQSLNNVEARLNDVIADLIYDGLVNIRHTGTAIEVEIRDNVLFESGSAVINSAAQEPLARIAEVLRHAPNHVQVEGFTDNVPINTPLYPSNWELSAGRAASVVHLLMTTGVQPQRMTAVGYGEYRPAYDNTREEGRMRNRRVVLVIKGEEQQVHADPVAPNIE